MAWPNPSMTRWCGGPDRAIVEDGLTLTVHLMARALTGRAGSRYSGSWQWSIDGEVCAEIGYTITLFDSASGRLCLNYRMNGEPVEQSIRLLKVPCRFGGGRWFAVCPRTGRTVAKLYKPLGSRQFLARQAYRMGYRSQCDDPAGRAMRRKRKIAARHGMDVDLCIRPKGMRHRTYKRLLDVFESCDRVFGVECIRKFGMEL